MKMDNISKRAILMAGIGILSGTMLTACGSKSNNNEKTSTTSSVEITSKTDVSNTTSYKETTGSSEADSVSTVDEKWKSAYIDYINNNLSSKDFEQFALIYVDNDDIPELVAIGNCEAVGCIICTYTNGSVQDTQLSRLNFTYIEKNNLLCNSDGNMDSYYDIVYSINNGCLTTLATGEYGAEDNSNMKFNEDGSPLYVYKWNHKSVSEEDYNNALSKIYDQSKAVPGYDEQNSYTRQEIINQLNK